VAQVRVATFQKGRWTLEQVNLLQHVRTALARSIFFGISKGQTRGYSGEHLKHRVKAHLFYHKVQDQTLRELHRVIFIFTFFYRVISGL
jgi:hypothetical protein